MKIIKPSAHIMFPVYGRDILRRLEQIGRVCYKSEGAIMEDTAEPFVRKIIERGHESVLEHCSVTVKFTVDRGVSHEIVRHRLAAYSQESTRYCNYSGDKFGSEIIVIDPVYLEHDTPAYNAWRMSCEEAERQYFELLECGCTAQEARAVLPNSLKTEIVMTANIREWRHFFRLRAGEEAHPQMREVTVPLLYNFKSKIPVVFDDIGRRENK